LVLVFVTLSTSLLSRRLCVCVVKVSQSAHPADLIIKNCPLNIKSCPCSIYVHGAQLIKHHM
jgi:hypothetical protein